MPTCWPFSWERRDFRGLPGFLFRLPASYGQGKAVSQHAGEHSGKYVCSNRAAWQARPAVAVSPACDSRGSHQNLVKNMMPMFLGCGLVETREAKICRSQGTTARTDEPDHGRHHEHAQGAKQCLELRFPAESFSGMAWTAMHRKLRLQALIFLAEGT